MTAPLRPDVAFVLAALRCDASASRAQRAAAEDVDDWAAVARFALQHDVPWRVMRALPRAGVPDEVRATIGDSVRAVAVQALAGARQVAELSRVLADAGVRAVAYKGPTLASDVHGDLGARWFTDLDFLVAESDRDRARRVFADTGYASPHFHSAREERFFTRWEGVINLTRGDDLPVELHWRCQAPRYGGPQDPAGIVARARSLSMGGGSVLVPSAEDLGVLLAVHGVKHAWGSLLWVADFTAALSRPEFDWSLFASRAASWQVRRAAHFAVLVAHALVALNLPAAVLSAAQSDARAAYLAGAVVARLTLAPDAPDIGAESTMRYDLQWLDGTWGRLRYLALAATLPTLQERRVARLPDALLPLAYPVRAWRLLRHALGRRR